MLRINDQDLRKNKYDIDTLIHNINHLYIKNNCKYTNIDC